MIDPRYYVDEAGCVRDSAADMSVLEREGELSETEIVECLTTLEAEVEGLKAENQMLLSGSAEAAVVRQSRITELKAEVEGLRIANKELDQDKAGLANRMVEAASQMKALRESRSRWEKDRNELEALRVKVADSEWYWNSGGDQLWCEDASGVWYWDSGTVRHDTPFQAIRTAREVSDE